MKKWNFVPFWTFFFLVLLFSKPTRAEERFRRWGVSVGLGGVAIGESIKGYKMLPAFTFGGAASFDILPFLGVFLNAQMNFVHFSDGNSSRSDSMDMSSGNYIAGVEFRVPGVGFYVAPGFGFSNVTYNYRKEGGLSHRDRKGADNMQTYGLALGWHFLLGKRILLGPRFEYLRYKASNGDYLPSFGTYALRYHMRFLF